jgi:hypothetical protein
VRLELVVDPTRVTPDVVIPLAMGERPQ